MRTVFGFSAGRIERWLIVSIVLGCLWVSTARALDTIRLLKGTSLNGTIESMSPREITLKLANGSSDSIPVNTVDTLRFAGEPSQLNAVRAAVRRGDFAAAHASLEKIPKDAKGLERAEIEQDYLFYQALCAARLALGGHGEINAAGKQMQDFVHKHPNSYHFIEASEALGDLLMAINKPDLARDAYASVERAAPWSDVKTRAHVAQGYALLAQDKGAEALDTFEAALRQAGEEDNPAMTQQRQSATLGKAAALAGTGKFDDGIKMAEAVIAEADPAQTELYARAYNTLGNCLLKADRKKEALLAFLHVDQLYANHPLAHAEALKNLVALWSELGNPQRSAEAQQMLKARYGNTRWGKKVSGLATGVARSRRDSLRVNPPQAQP